MMDEKLLNQCMQVAAQWANDPVFDADTRAAVSKMMDDEDKSLLVDSFYQTLEFGTGGLRGVMGPGTNRMNIYTVGTATQGLANYLKKNFADRERISIVVGVDCRNNSDVFAERVADIMAANGIYVYLFEDMRPTPEVSFAIRHLGCQSGVNITASHNPREYNGYKAYWEDGAQVLSPHDKGIIDEVNNCRYEDVKTGGDRSFVTIIGEEVDQAYIEAVHTLSIDPEAIQRQKNLGIVYTPLHGAGMMIVPRALRSWGFENVNCVPEQMVKDGNFPTVVSPNPENAEAMTLAVSLAKKINADIVIASDPDADRIAMACVDDKGEWAIINGNQTMLILLYYIIKNRVDKGMINGDEFVVKTIVTTELVKKVADRYHIEMRDCYTGFKWIAHEIAISEGVKKYIGGGEESFGFLAEDFCRDKDSPSACCLIAEICAWAKDKGKSLYQILMDIYLEYGFLYNKAVNVVRPGKSGADEIKQMMENFRNNPPKELAGTPIQTYKDFRSLESKDALGNTTPLQMPDTSNVLQYFCSDGTKLSIRPSGTEPKIKFYLEIPAEMKTADDYRNASSEAEKTAAEILKSLNI
ncbi:MAG: phospho-sugar mutase [Bacteroidaceae bacterium]|nr:phospho-sugar mutase [Bacteroidaceae bacterium]